MNDMTSATATFVLAPVSAAEAAAMRRSGGEVYVADAKPGYPCRQCLRDAEIGEELVPISHDPFELDSPYRSASPIFVHRHDCAAQLDADPVPEQLGCRQLSVRAFDAAEMMIEAAVVDGTDLETTIARMFEADAAERIHVHNASRGCWAVAVDRA